MVWSYNEVKLTSPTSQQCNEALVELKEKKCGRVELWSSSTEIALQILSQLHQVSKVNDLYVYGTPLNDECMNYVIQLINNNQLISLKLSSSTCAFTDSAVQKLSDSLKQNKRLKTLEIYYKSADTSTIALCEVIKANKTISSFHLNRTHLKS